MTDDVNEAVATALFNICRLDFLDQADAQPSAPDNHRLTNLQKLLRYHHRAMVEWKMITEPWRVENWDQGGNFVGYRVVKGSGQTLVVAAKGGFVVDIYDTKCSAPIMLKAAKRLCKRLNRVAGWIVVKDAEWRSVGVGRQVFNGCTTEYLKERYGADNVTHVSGSGWLRRDPNFVATEATA